MKKVIIGFIAGAVFASSGTVLASSVFETVSAVIRDDYTMRMDGNPVVIENDPVIIEGTSYLPVREVASILGKEVDFDSGVIALNTDYEDPAAVLAKFRLDESAARSNVVAFEKELQESEAKGNEAQSEKLRAVIALMQESVTLYANKIADLLERYPDVENK